MKIWMNIGLTPSAEFAGISITGADVAKHLRAYDMQLVRFRLQSVAHEHGTEDTALVQVNYTNAIDPPEGVIRSLANVLHQDCIAAVYWDGKAYAGKLLGPRPYTEGFNPEFFVFP